MKRCITALAALSGILLALPVGLELKDEARFNAAFWPDATITAMPEPGKRFVMSYGMALKPPPMPPGT